MELFKRWRKDKKFRMNFVIGVILFLIILSNISDKKQGQVASESTCAQFNGGVPDNWRTALLGGSPYLLNKALSLIGADSFGVNNMDGCLANGCIITFDEIHTEGECLGKFVFGDWDMRGLCSAYGTTQPFIASSRTKADQACSTGNSTTKYTTQDTGKTYCDEPYYTCNIVDMSNPFEANLYKEQTCDSWAKPFAGILDAIWKKNGMDSCNTKAFIVIGGLIFVVLAVM